jgi:hypothetical protein
VAEAQSGYLRQSASSLASARIEEAKSDRMIKAEGDHGGI